MDGLLDQLSLDTLPDHVQQGLAIWGNQHLRTFLFVLARLVGMLLVIPFLAGMQLPRHIQLGLGIVLALILTPAVEAVQAVPASGFPPPSEWLWSGLVEFACGGAIGLGVGMLLGSLQMAGELIDLQMGLRPRDVLQQSAGNTTSLTGQLLLLCGLAAFLILPPIGTGSHGGLLLLLDAFVQSFQSIPAGAETLSLSLGSMVVGWLQSSLTLCLLVAAPIISCATLVAIFVGVIGRSVPEANTMSIGFPLRTIVCLLVLTMTLSGETSRVTKEISIMLDQFHTAMTG